MKRLFFITLCISMSHAIVAMDIKKQPDCLGKALTTVQQFHKSPTGKRIEAGVLGIGAAMLISHCGKPSRFMRNVAWISGALAATAWLTDDTESFDDPRTANFIFGLAGILASSGK